MRRRNAQNSAVHFDLLGGHACDFSKPTSGFGSIEGEVRAEQPSYATVAVVINARAACASIPNAAQSRFSPPRRSFTKSPADDVEERREQQAERGHANHAEEYCRSEGLPHLESSAGRD